MPHRWAMSETSTLAKKVSTSCRPAIRGRRDGSPSPAWTMWATRPSKRYTSELGWIARCVSARRDVSVPRGSTTTSFRSGSRWMALIMSVERTPRLLSMGLLPRTSR